MRASLIKTEHFKRSVDALGCLGDIYRIFGVERAGEVPLGLRNFVCKELADGVDELSIHGQIDSLTRRRLEIEDLAAVRILCHLEAGNEKRLRSQGGACRIPRIVRREVGSRKDFVLLELSDRFPAFGSY